jgi:hypothetical protein
MIVLLQRLLGQPFPAFRPIDSLGRLIEVTTLDSKIESSASILNEMQRNLKVNYVNGSSEKESSPRNNLPPGNLLLQIRNDTLAQQSRSTNDMKHLFLIVTKEREFETVLCRIERDRARAGRAIEAVYRFALDACKIDGVVESAYDTMIAVMYMSVGVVAE